MKTWLITIAGGYIVGAVSHAIIVWWLKNRESIKTTLNSLDERLEERMGRTLPKWVHDATAGFVERAVSAADKFFSDGANVRNVIRSLFNGGFSSEEIKKKLLAIDWAGNIAAQLPEEYKPFFNKAKEDMATKIVMAETAKFLPTAHVPTESEARVMVKVAAPAGKVVEEPKPVTKELLEKLIEESKARQEKMRNG